MVKRTFLVMLLSCFIILLSCMHVKNLTSLDDGVLSYTPLNFNPTGAYATHRITNTTVTYIIRARRVVAADVVDIYDFERGTSNYKLSSSGSWLDGSGETFYVAALYDQSGNGYDVTQDVESAQPILLLNQQNGNPVIRFDGIDDRLRSSVDMSSFMNPSIGTMFVNFKTTGATPVLGANPWAGDTVLADAEGFIVISRANVAASDRIWVDHFALVEDFVDVSYTADSWINITWMHNSGNLYSYKNGLFVSSVPSGDTGSSLNSNLVMGKTDYNTNYFTGDANQYYLFASDIDDFNIFMINFYSQSN